MAIGRAAHIDRCRVAAVVLAALAVAPSTDARADDMMRCRNDAIIRIGMVAAEVAARCGEPQSKDVNDVPVRVRHANGTVGISGYTRVEHWTYDRGYGQFKGLLTFEDGELKTIELQTGR